MADGSVPHGTSLAAVQLQARIDLAAAHRMAWKEGLNEGIFNHLTLRVPGHDDRYYQIPFGLHWSEVYASCFMEVGYDGKLLAGEGNIESSTFGIHAPIHRLNPEAACVMHTHQPFASALGRLEDQRILPIGQTEVGFLGDTAYDDDYAGLGNDTSEGERLAKVLGNKHVMMMGNHGVLTIGKNVAAAYNRLYYIERVAQVQIYAMWTGRKLKEVKPGVVQKIQQDIKGSIGQIGGRDLCDWHFDALKRMLDREDDSYRN